MIEALIGASAMVLLFISHYTAYYMGHRQKKIDVVTKLTKEEEEAFKKHVKGMENVLNYDYDVAIGRRANN